MEEAPTPWRLILDQLTRVEAAALTRAEFGAHRASLEAAVAELRLRIDKAQAATADAIATAKADNAAKVVKLETEVDRLEGELRAVEKARDDAEKDRRKERSTRLFSIVMAGVALLSSVVSGVLVFVATGLLGPL